MTARNSHRSEIELQRKYLAELGDNSFPIFNSRQAIQSQRKSGYRNTARAAREIVDNSIEAGAENIWIAFETVGEARQRSGNQGIERKRNNTVSAVAFIDDGPGMIHESSGQSMLRAALTLGGGTRSKNPNFIGKFGFGLPNASINQTEYVEVFTRHDRKAGWNRCHIDIREGSPMLSGAKDGVVKIPEVETDVELPAFVVDFLKDRKITLATGTIVVWQQPDRLFRSGRDELRKHLVHDFECVYRGLLNEVSVFVDSTVALKPLDPLFLQPDASFYLPKESGGAELLLDERIQVLAWADSAGGWNLETVGDAAGEDPITGWKIDHSVDDAQKFLAKRPAGVSSAFLTTVGVRMSYLPYPFFMSAKPTEKCDPDAAKRFMAKDSRYGISFVRAKREIDVYDALPRGEGKKRTELGSWPNMNSYSLYVSTEVSFGPELDGLMGIGNDKQSVSPSPCLWEMLAKCNVDGAMRRGVARRAADGRVATERRLKSEGVDLPAITAASHASTMEKAPAAVTPRAKASQARFDQQLDVESAKKAEETKRPVAEVKAEISEQLAKKRFEVVGFESPGGVFMEPVVGPGGAIVVRINSAHPWYRYYRDSDANGRNAINLLLIALAKAELQQQSRADDEGLGGGGGGAIPSVASAYYEALVWLRESSASPFLRDSARVMAQTMPRAGEAVDEDEIQASLDAADRD